MILTCIILGVCGVAGSLYMVWDSFSDSLMRKREAKLWCCFFLFMAVLIAIGTALLIRLWLTPDSIWP